MDRPEMSFSMGFHSLGAHHVALGYTVQCRFSQGENSHGMMTSKPEDDTTLRGCALPKEKVEWFFPNTSWPHA